MERFQFTSDIGDIIFAKGSPYVFSSVTGLDGGSVKRQITEYSDIDGAAYENPLYDIRLVTLKGFINASDLSNLSYLKRNLIKTINGKDIGILRYNNGYKEYFSKAVPDMPEWGERVQNVLPFILYFNLTDFYWFSKNKFIKDIYKRTDLLTGQFTFPCAFTLRESKGILANSGDVPTDIIIKINCSEVSDEESEETGLEIKNNTTGEFMVIEYDIAKNEVIIIDTKEFTIESSVNGNILHKMNENSNFFQLQRGINEIEAIDYSTGKSISMTIEYYEKFVGV